MTETPKKKLIEVALPLEAINAACKEDKDRKTGTIRNLHKWFAPMPVPALRALIFASLVDDPGDEVERARLFKLLEGLVASVVDDPPQELLDQSLREITRSVGELPTVLDPFCGGGSTLVEAQRLGLRSRGSDLNPVPILISKMLTELPPGLVGRKPLNQDGQLTESTWPGLSGFLRDVEVYGKKVQDTAREQIGNLYPLSPNGDPVIAWWWANAVGSPDPRFQEVSVPLVNNWWLSKKKGDLAYVEPVWEPVSKTLRYEIRTSGQPRGATKSECVLSGAPISFEYIKRERRAGRGQLSLLAMVSMGRNGRRYHGPTKEDLRQALEAKPADESSLPLPEEALGFTFQLYGNDRWSDVFTRRQRKALETFADLVAALPERILSDGGDEEYATAVVTFLGLCVGKLAQASSTQCRWKLDSRNGVGKAEVAAFGRNDVTMMWDFVETNPFGGSVGDWMQIVETASRALRYVHAGGPPSVVLQSDARRAGAGLESSCLVVTDPPYFSAIGYANLSDYFYPWIRRAVRSRYPGVMATIATPKDGELIAEPARHESKDAAKQYFIDGFTETFLELRSAGRPDLPLCIVYANKEQENENGAQVSSGWEAMLEAIIRSGLAVVGTWPIHGTGSTRMRGLKSNAVATYVVLVCRTRSSASPRISQRDFVAALRSELGPAVRLLQSAAVAPVDMAQAVIGPGMAVFTRYDAVLEPSGGPMPVRSALLLINSVLAEVLDQEEGDLDAETRWAVAWFEQYQFGEAPSGEADALARAKVTSIDRLERSGVVLTKGGKTRLLSRDELPDHYRPDSDSTPTIWEAVQHLVKAFYRGGEQSAAELLAGFRADDTARELAYRLYSICRRRSWAEEALAYNVLVASWPEISQLARSMRANGLGGRLPGIE